MQMAVKNGQFSSLESPKSLDALGRRLLSNMDFIIAITRQHG